MKLFSKRMSLIPKELFGLKVEVIRSRRKTSVLRIVGNELQIKVPNRAKDRNIFKILETKERWIRNKATKLQNEPIIKESRYKNGESFPLFGRYLKLKILEAGKVGTELIDNYLVTTVRSSEIGELRKSRIKICIQKWYPKEESKY